MTIEEKRRELFHVALRRDWAAHLVSLDREGAGYVFLDINSAWWAFNAALDAVEIELPRPFPSVFAGADEYADGIAECRKAIESTGLGLKVKP